jgi:hypothetical protein
MKLLRRFLQYLTGSEFGEIVHGVQLLKAIGIVKESGVVQ